MSQIIKLIKGTLDANIDAKRLLKIAYKYHITTEQINQYKSQIDART